MFQAILQWMAVDENMNFLCQQEIGAAEGAVSTWWVSVGSVIYGFFWNKSVDTTSIPMPCFYAFFLLLKSFYCIFF